MHAPASPGGWARWRLIGLWLIPLALAAVVYAPIVSNYFWGDDFLTLFRLRDLDRFDYLMRPQGSHLYAATGAVFWAADRLFGPHPRGFFYIALLTHLLNVALLFAVIRRLAGSERLACLGATLWGTSPVLEAALGWMSVYGHVLAATVILAVLVHLARLADGARLRPLAPLAWAALLFVAATSFGIGIGMALVMPLVAWLLLPSGRQRLWAAAALAVIGAGVAALYIGTLRYFAVPGSGTIVTDLLRIWEPVLGFTVHLFGYGFARALSGTLGGSLYYPSRVATAIVVIGVGLVIAGALLGPPPTGRRILAVLVLALGGYGMVAAGRAAYFGGGAAAGRVDRYHYLGLALLVLACCIALAGVAARLRLREWMKDGLLALAVGAIALGYARSTHVIDHHLDFQRQTRWVIEAIARAIEAVPPGRPAYVGNEVFLPMGPLYANAKLIFPGWSGVFVIFYPENVVRGRPVYFVEPDRTIIEGMRGRRTNGLLVSTIPRAPVDTSSP